MAIDLLPLDKGKLLTCKEVAMMLRKSTKWVQRNQRRIGLFHLGHRLHCFEADLKEYLLKKRRMAIRNREV